MQKAGFMPLCAAAILTELDRADTTTTKAADVRDNELCR